MKMLSFKLFVSLLLVGALSVLFSGCGLEGVADDDIIEQIGALMRVVSFVNVEVAVVESTVIVKSIKMVIANVIVTLTQVLFVFGIDYDCNYLWSVFFSGTGGLSCRGMLIHFQWVFTVVHCIGFIAGFVGYSRIDPVMGVVSSGSRLFNQSGSQRGMFVHLDFKFDTGFGQLKNDIALIWLATLFAIDCNIQMAALLCYWANAGWVGTIATNNHSNASVGYVSIVRAPQLTDDECTSSDGFICISLLAGSMCHGDSGFGFVEIRDGCATIIGVISNIDSDGSECISVNKQVQFVDVYAYRDWIYATMGMSSEQVDGCVRLCWSGVVLQLGIMSLQCLLVTMLVVEVLMNILGSEIVMDCDDMCVFCQLQGANLNLYSFMQRTFAANGMYMGMQVLLFLLMFTVAFVDFGLSFLGFNCSVYNSVSLVLLLSIIGTMVKVIFQLFGISNFGRLIGCCDGVLVDRDTRD